MSLDINLTNVQSTPIVVNANTTAENNKVYHVIANATFTDPTGVQGIGYVVFVRNGTATIGGIGYTVGRFILRIFHSGGWNNFEWIDAVRNSNLFVPQTRTINGLDLTANRTLTTANINDSTDKRYVTDAQLTVLGNTSGTNTGDQNLSGLVPYTGATADVDLDTFGLDAKFIKIKGTAGNGHLNLKHQSSDATAGGSESVLYADNSGNPKWKNDGNAVQNVMLENSAITGATKTKITYDSKGLVTAGADATTADIADSSNKRYVTDAQLTVIGNTSGTNSGDETQSTILSKLGWFTYNRVAESTAVTGTTAETIIENITIPANTFVNGGIIRSYNNKFRKVGSSGTLAIRLYIGPTANNLTGATLVGSYTGIIASQNYVDMLRTFTATTSGILGISPTQSNAVDTGSSSGGRLSASIDWTVQQNFMITVQLGNSADSVSLMGASLKNF